MRVNGSSLNEKTPAGSEGFDVRQQNTIGDIADGDGSIDDLFRTPVSVIVPAFNEEDAVGPQIEAIRRELIAAGIQHEIVIVDDGSTDRTAEAALQAGARVLQHSENRGYGSSLKTGIIAAEYETIVISDADGTYPANQIPGLLANLRTADMVVGARTGKNVEIPWQRRPAKRLLGWLAELIAGRRIPDLNSGLRAFRRSSVKQYFPILSNKFSFTTTVTLALIADDYRVVYQPIDYYRRAGGQSKISPRHFMDFTILVLRMAMLFQPLKLFVPMSLAFGAMGFLKVVFDVATIFSRHSAIDVSLLYQPAISTSAVLLLLVALQFLLIGMVADGVLRRMAQLSGPLVPSHAVRYFDQSTTQKAEKELMLVPSPE